MEPATTFFLGSTVLSADTTHIVEVYGDAKEAGGTNYSHGHVADVGVSVALADTEGVHSGERIASSIFEVEGSARIISSTSLAASKASGFGNQTVVAGANNIKLGSFALSTNATEGVDVNTIVINLSSNEATTITDLRLVNNATGAQLGTTKSSPSNTNTFSVNFPMGVSQTKVIDVYANIKAGSGNGPWIATLDDMTGGLGATSGQFVTIGSDVDLQTITIGSGVLTVTLDPGTPSNFNVIAGTNSVQVGKFDFAAANSSFTIQELKVKIPNDAATSVSNVILKYRNSAGVEQSVSQPITTGSQAYATATFTGLTMYVPANDSSDLDVYVDIPTISSGSKSGAAISVLIDANEGFKALDAGGSLDTSAAGADINSAASSGYGTKYVKKSVPTLARLTTGYTTNTVASGVGLYRFSITADAAGTIDWREVSFNIATTGVVLDGFTLFDVTGTALAVNSSATSTNYAAAGSTFVLAICPGGANGCVHSETVDQVGAGSTKTYELRASTISGWGSAGDSLTISFADDPTAILNAKAASLHASNYMVWSDRSSTSHSTTTSDWTNGYLVKDTDNDTRSCQFGTQTTCTP